MTTRACPIRLGQQRTTTPRRQVPLNVIVPLGGLSSNEFTEAGYRMPKPMVPIVGRPMLLWMIDNLELLEGDQIWIGLRRDVEKKYTIKQMLQREFPQHKIRVVCFDFETRGATETLYCILNAMDDADRSRRTISLDSDTIWFCDVLGGARALPENCGASFYFNDLQDDATAPYSYIRIDDKGRIVDIREKVAISRLANNGAYVFESAASALEGLEGLLDEACSTNPNDQPPPPSSTPPATQMRGDEETVSLEEDSVDEDRVRYVSGLIEHMIRKHDSLFLAVLANDFASLGSPAKVRAFIARLRRGEVVGSRPMRFCFGLDGTLLTLEDDEDSYEKCRPIAKNIAIARELHDAGHTIIIYTDRGMKKRGGAAAAALADVGRITFAQLETHSIPCDEVVFGKPHADVYVDSHAINPLLGDKFEDAIGWDLELVLGANSSNSDLSNAVAPRHFNSIRRVGDDHVEKTGPRSVMRGEIHWYQNMPVDLVDLFPQALSVKEHPAQELSSVVMARVAGVTFSHLVVNSCLSPGRLLMLLSSLHRIHTTLLSYSAKNSANISDELICSNYRAKVEERYNKHKAVFDAFDNTADTYRVVIDALRDYETRKAYKRVNYIHGDPVFSNCMLTGDSKVKLLDMRGALGDTLTTEGDVLYDLSKVYQSLCGYDFIILDVEKTKQAEAILQRLRDDVFKSWLHDQHPDIDMRDIKMITAAHYFCIVPLHENRQHQTQFLQAAKEIFASLS